MTKVDIVKDMKIILSQDPDFLKPVVQQLLQEFLEAEMAKTIGADAYKRCDDRTGYRSGYYSRQLVTRVGTMQLRVPRDREGKFSTQLFERYQRSEKALVAALAEMYVQGVSTRKVKAITEELCGHDFSASTISNINKMLDSQLQLFAQRRLERPYPYVILDARYEKVRTEGAIASQAILVAIGINQDGKKEILGVELANRESRASWKDFLTSLKNRGLCGVEFVVSDHHEGLKKAIREIYPEALGKGALFIFYEMLSTTFQGRGITLAYKSCDRFTSKETLLKPRRSLGPGWESGKTNTQNYVYGQKKT